MSTIGGFTQDQLSEIWDSFDGNQPNPAAKKVVDDDSGHVMIMNTNDGLLAVSRKDYGEMWQVTPCA